MRPTARFFIILLLLVSTGIVLAQKPDTTTYVNGWKLNSYSPEIAIAKTYYDATSSYHGKYSQWFEISRSTPDYAYFRQHTATFKKQLNKRFAKGDYSEIAVNAAHTYPQVSTIIETPNLELAFGNRGSISNFQTIINTYNDKWLSIALSNNFASMDSIDCIYFKVGGSFLSTKVQVDYLLFGKNSTGTIIIPIEDFEDAIVVGIEERKNILPNNFGLAQNYPNPFNPETTIEYSIPVETRHASSLQKVTLKIYDALGREVATLVDEYKQAGNYKVMFNVETRHGASLPSGIYFYQLRAGRFAETKKLCLIK